MFLLLLLLVSLGHLLCASPVLKGRASKVAIERDAPFTVDVDTLAAALTCPNGNPSASSPPVLLVHGTGSTGAETWGEGYVPALLANGYTACYVTLPGRAMGDIQLSSEYVAYNLHNLASLSGGLSPAVITHSQGGPMTQWALEFWPSTRAITRAFIPLSPDLSGIDLLRSTLAPICTAIKCPASLWQQRAGSNFYSALRAHNFQALVSTTAVWTKFDGVVTPSRGNAELTNSKSISVQQLCPLRATNHVFMTIDAAAFAIALDALDHHGTASLLRLFPKSFATCLQLNAKHMKLNLATQLSSLFDDLTDGILLEQPRVSAEPAVMPYAMARLKGKA